jgi:hypothetical protein
MRAKNKLGVGGKKLYFPYFFQIKKLGSMGIKAYT